MDPLPQTPPQRDPQPFTELDREIRECKRCEHILSRYGVVPRPIVGGRPGMPVLLLGQAPGKTEYETGLPFQGEAGQSIKELFARYGLIDFEGQVFQTSVTKCFPGRRSGSSSDRTPGRKEVGNCLPFLVLQLELLQPRLVVCLGALSWRTILHLLEQEQPGFCRRELGVDRPDHARSRHVIGRKFQWRQAIVLPMIHPAGSANGARAAHPELDHESKQLLKSALNKIGALGTPR